MSPIIPVQPASTVSLNDGSAMPKFGFDTEGASETQILSALAAGVRLVIVPESASEIVSASRAMKLWRTQGGDNKDDTYIVTRTLTDGAEKCDQRHPRQTLVEQLKILGRTSVNLYLLDRQTVGKSPFDLQSAWMAMEDLQEDGLAKSIGVADWNKDDILAIKSVWKIPPAVNKIEYHPYCHKLYGAGYASSELTPLDDCSLRALMYDENIKVLAYAVLCPLHRAPGGPVDPMVPRIAAAHGTTDGAVLMAWTARHGGGSAVTLVTSMLSRVVEADTQASGLHALVLNEEDIREIAKAGERMTFQAFPPGAPVLTRQ